MNKLKKELINTLINKIVIDKDRNITIKYKYDVIPEVIFEYENRNLVRNPYGRNGKNKFKNNTYYELAKEWCIWNSVEFIDDVIIKL